MFGCTRSEASQLISRLGAAGLRTYAAPAVCFGYGVLICLGSADASLVFDLRPVLSSR